MLTRNAFEIALEDVEWWVQNTVHRIASLTHEQVEHRKKRRTTIEDVYKLQYRFAIGGNAFENSFEITEAQFNELQGAPQVEVWYAKDKPAVNAIPSDLERKVRDDTLLGNVFNTALFVLPGAFFLNLILSLIFVREPKGVLAEGFYKENAWLDIDDRYLIAVEDGQLMVFGFEAKEVDKVQRMYQSDVPVQQIFASVKGKLTCIKLDEVKSISSYHHSDSFSLKHGDKDTSQSVEFLSVATKEHALSNLLPKLSGQFDKKLLEKTRLQAALPGLIGVFAAIVVFYFFGGSVFGVLGGLALLYFSLPSFLARLFDPSVITTWTKQGQTI